MSADAISELHRVLGTVPPPAAPPAAHPDTHAKPPAKRRAVSSTEKGGGSRSFGGGGHTGGHRGGGGVSGGGFGDATESEVEAPLPLAVALERLCDDSAVDELLAEREADLDVVAIEHGRAAAGEVDAAVTLLAAHSAQLATELDARWGRRAPRAPNRSRTNGPFSNAGRS